MTPVTDKDVSFRTSNSATLRGTLFVPAAPCAVVVLSGATGVPRGFYARFARWLAEERSLACLTYDYRDMEDPSPARMKASPAQMVDWAISDGQAARDAARARFPDLPVWVIGHSLGGMMVSKQPRLDGITQLITIASGLVDHKRHPLPYRVLVYLFWFVLGPAATRLMGYLPGKTIGLGSTLPADVFWQWRKWCTAGPRGFLEDDSLPASDWTRSGAPVRIIGISDDVICTVPMAQAIAAAYSGAQITQVTLDPAQRGAGKLGHFGLFSRNATAFWSDIVPEDICPAASDLRAAGK